MGVRTVNTSVRPIASIGLLPIFGKACRSRVCIHERACLSLRQRGLLTSWTVWTALLNVGVAGLHLSATGSFPSAIAARLSAARFLAWASDTVGYPPRPISRRRPSMVTRCTQLLPSVLLMNRCRPSPSEYRPGFLRTFTLVADNKGLRETAREASSGQFGR